ncbi:AfsR/SARP family transcriptional regulator [Streptomyces profundus]|uniref:AfsR/SARP family transcriptional regulator n=1 Tax=Streptomyces profundus TaxID=2867410 RepID=UPI001D168FC8|nr:BTAD domain-containing putative transcriptional regulator [Streptomyces sp. MA3_2.13]UED88162.1 tetratricopeptide repeat protein [Streptomyces sp. MA3_2.13]
MRFLVLGPVQIQRDGDAPEAVSGRLRRTLLGVLLARADQPVPVDHLTETLWGEQPDERAGQRLHLHVHRLRAALDTPDRLVFDNDGYRLRVHPQEIDAQHFEDLATQGQDLLGDDPRRAATALSQALALWRGTPFTGLDVPLLTDWTHRLTERRLAASEALYEARITCGQETAVVAELTALVRQHPLRERLHGLLMVALHRSGRQSDALAAYRDARERLVDELGLEPGPELRDLERRVLAGDPIELGGQHTPHPAVPAQLPTDVTGFAGRDTELAELDQLLLHRLTTHGPVVISAVAGTAGVGKTALAVRWAHQARDHFPDGQLYVDLRGYGPDQPIAPEDALAGFLRALGVEGAGIPQETAERAARFRTLVDGRRMLIVLDNARSAEQIRPLLPGSPTCRALVTSRDTLAGLVAREGAHRLSLDRLPLDDARALMADMLGTRTHAEPEATDTLIEQCARLPLALRITAELARSQPTRTITDLAEELADQQETLDLLDIDGDPHTAVRAVFSWSYRQLPPDAARVFRLLGLHPGHDIDPHAAAALADRPLRPTRRALRTLLRAHLIDQSTTSRYQPHDLLRAYAAELATTADSHTEREAALTRLRHYYRATASTAMDALAPYETARRPTVPTWPGEAPPLTTHDHALRWLDTERANLVEATRHGDPTFVTTLSETLWRYFDIGGYYDESTTVHTRALEAATTTGDTLGEANARRLLGVTLERVGRNLEAAIDHLQQALTLYEHLGESPLVAAALLNLGNVHNSRGDNAQARRHYEATLELSDGDWALRRAALINLSGTLRQLGHHQAAIHHLTEALPLCREHNEKPNEANIHSGLALCYAAMGETDQAFAHVRRGLDLARSTSYRLIEAHCLRVLGILHQQRDNLPQALHWHQEAVTLARAIGNSGLIATALNGLAAAQAQAGHPHEALRTYHEATAVATEGDHREKLAHTHEGLAELHTDLGDHPTARHHWQQALTRYEALGLPQATTIRTRLATTDTG